LSGLLGSKVMPGWTALFLVTTILTNATRIPVSVR